MQPYLFFVSFALQFQIGRRNRKIFDVLIYKNMWVIINELKYKIEAKVGVEQIIVRKYSDIFKDDDIVKENIEKYIY